MKPNQSVNDNFKHQAPPLPREGTSGSRATSGVRQAGHTKKKSISLLSKTNHSLTQSTLSIDLMSTQKQQTQNLAQQRQSTGSTASIPVKAQNQITEKRKSSGQNKSLRELKSPAKTTQVVGSLRVHQQTMSRNKGAMNQSNVANVTASQMTTPALKPQNDASLTSPGKKKLVTVSQRIQKVTPHTSVMIQGSHTKRSLESTIAELQNKTSESAYMQHYRKEQTIDVPRQAALKAQSKGRSGLKGSPLTHKKSIQNWSSNQNTRRERSSGTNRTAKNGANSQRNLQIGRITCYQDSQTTNDSQIFNNQTSKKQNFQVESAQRKQISTIAKTKHASMENKEDKVPQRRPQTSLANINFFEITPAPINSNKHQPDTQAVRHRKNYQSYQKSIDQNISSREQLKVSSTRHLQSTNFGLFADREDKDPFLATGVPINERALIHAQNEACGTEGDRHLTYELRRSIMSNNMQQSAGHAPKVEFDDFHPDASFDYGGCDDDILSEKNGHQEVIQARQEVPKNLSPTRLQSAHSSGFDNFSQANRSDFAKSSLSLRQDKTPKNNLSRIVVTKKNKIANMHEAASSINKRLETKEKESTFKSGGFENFVSQSGNEEDLLDQTLGKTLTHQKLILDQINTKTQSNFHMMSVEDSNYNRYQRRLTYDIRQPRRGAQNLDDSNLLQVSTSYIQQEGNPPDERAIASTIDGQVGSATGSRFMNSKANSPRQAVVTENSGQLQSPIKTFQQMKAKKSAKQQQNQQMSFNLQDLQDNEPAKDGKKVQSSDDDGTDDDDGGTSEQDERTGAQVNPVVMRSNPNHNMVPLAKQKSSPGDNLMNLRDRGKSASRVEGSKRFDGLSGLNKGQNNRLMGKDLSIPTLKKSNSKDSPQTKELNLRLSNLTILQKQVFMAPQHANLRQVDVRNNRLNDLPGEICTLQYLTHLRLDYNYLQALPYSLGNLSNLQYLSTSQNRLQELPDSLFHSESQLQILLANDNKIGNIQRSLGRLKKLTQLFLHSNLLVELPTSILQLSKLTDFSVDWLIYVDSQCVETEPEEFQTNPEVDQTVMEESGRKTDVVKDQNLVNPKLEQEKKPPPQGNKKVLRGEKGAAMIKDIKLLMTFIDQAQRQVRHESMSYHSASSTQQDSNGFVHFIQFVMFFYHQGSIQNVKKLKFKHKQRSLLHQLATNGHLYLLKATVAVLGMNRKETSLDVNALDEDSSTALVLAMKQKRFEFVKYLLRLPSVSTSLQSSKYGMPLHVALAQCEFKLALKLIKRQSQLRESSDVNAPNEEGNTALHLIFHNFHTEPELATVVAKLLIRKGADLQIKNKNGLGILHCAITSGNIHALKYAIAHNKSLIKNKRNEDRFDFNGKGGQMNWSLLHFAIFHAHLPIINLLLTCGEYIDLEALDDHGKRAIDLCPFSSPIFKKIRDKLRRQARQKCKIEEFIEDEPQTHKVLSSRQCIVHSRPKRTIEQQQQLFNLMQQPADRLQQDVPPTLDPFPQKTVNHDYNSALLTEHQRTITEYNQMLNTNAPNIMTTTQGDMSARGAPKIDNHLSVPKGVTACPTQSDVQGPSSKAADNGLPRSDANLRSKKSSNHVTHSEAYDSNENIGTNNQDMFFTSQAAAFPYQMLNAEVDDLSREALEAPRIDNLGHNELPDRPSRLAQEFTDMSKMYTIDSSDEEPQQAVTKKTYQSPGVADAQVEVNETDLTNNLRPLNTSPVRAIILGQPIDEQTGQESDGENVEQDETEQPSNAFEARESQWNRKLSSVLSQEKKLHQRKVILAQKIVEAFEEAKRFRQSQQPTRKRDETEGKDLIEDEQQPQVAKVDAFSLEQIKEKLMQESVEVRVEQMVSNEEVDRELDQFIEAHALKSKFAKQHRFFDVDDDLENLKAKMLGQDQNQLKTPGTVSNELSPLNPRRLNGSFLLRQNPSQISNNALVQTPTPHEYLNGRKNDQSGSRFNLMSTVKVNDLKLVLQQNRIPGFVLEEDIELITPQQQVFITGNDWEVLIWAQKLNIVKVENSITILIEHIANRPSGYQKSQTESGTEPPTKTMLKLNLYELQNFVQEKKNEVEQKLQMRQLIVINSTGPGRHRKAPSEFSGAKTLKKKQLMSSISTTTLRKDDQDTKLRGLILQPQTPTMSQMNNNGFKQFQPKDYRIEDSMLIQSQNKNQPGTLEEQYDDEPLFHLIGGEHPKIRQLTMHKSSASTHLHRRNKSAVQRSSLTDQKPSKNRIAPKTMKRQDQQPQSMFKITFHGADKNSVDKQSQGSMPKTMLKDLLSQNEVKRPGSKQLSNQRSLQQFNQSKPLLPRGHINNAELSNHWQEIARNASSFGDFQPTNNLNSISDSMSTEQGRKSRAGVTSGMKMVQPSKKTVLNLENTLNDSEMLQHQIYGLRDFNSQSLELTNEANFDTEAGMMATNRKNFFEQNKTLFKKTVEELEMQNEGIIDEPDNMVAKQSHMNIQSKPCGIGMHLRQNNNNTIFTQASGDKMAHNAAQPKK